MPPPLFWKALAAFLALPGVVAFVVPLVVLAPPGADGRFAAAGTGLVAAGTALLLWCVRTFYVAGHGTLAPWSPPVAIVTTGPYRYSRNPMYVAVAAILAGWWAGFALPRYGLYLAVVMAAFQLRVVFGEEPWLARTFGAKWERYRAEVRRWL